MEKQSQEPDPTMSELVSSLRASFFSVASGVFDAARKSEKIDGFLSENEGALLFSMARSGYGVGAIVEIGSFKGKSTIWLALGSKSAGREKILAIDPHTGSPEHLPGGQEAETMPEGGTTFLEFTKNLEMADITDYVVPIREMAHDVAPRLTEPVRLLFIDGDHSYDSVERDYLTWAPLIITGGIIVFHDVPAPDVKSFPFDGPKRVVNKYLENNPQYLNLFHADTMQAYLKVLTD